MTSRCTVVVLKACIVLLSPASSTAQAVPATEKADAILPDTPAGRARMRRVESDVAWARVRVPGQRMQSLQQRMDAYRVRGLGIAVIRDYHIEWAKGYGWADVAAHRPVTARTLFEPGSISKALNAVGVLTLARENRVDLHANVNDYLRSWKLPRSMRAKERPITLAAILSHTAGLSVRGFWGYRRGDSLPTVAEILDGIGPAANEPVRSLFPPNTRFQYSGGGTMISQQVVMDVTSEPYASFMSRRVLAAMGMSDSFFTQPPPDSLSDRLATGYDAAGAPISGRYPVMPEQAAAGLWTTAVDLARFVIALQRALRGDTDGAIAPADARLLTTPVLPGSPGMGLFVVDTAGARYFEHGAGNAGMSGWLLGSTTSGNGVIVLQNGESAELLQELLRTVARVYEWPGLATKPVPAPAIVVPQPAVLDGYVGAYREGDMVLEVVRDNDGLALRGPGAPRRMYFTSPEDFFTQESTSRMRFARDSAGALTAVDLYADGRPVARARRVTERSLPPRTMQRYAGTYRDPRGAPVRLVMRNGALWLEIQGVARRARFLSTHDFFTEEDFGVGMRVESTASGRVLGLRQFFSGESVFLTRQSR